MKHVYLVTVEVMEGHDMGRHVLGLYSNLKSAKKSIRPIDYIDFTGNVVLRTKYPRFTRESSRSWILDTLDSQMVLYCNYYITKMEIQN